MRWSDLVPLADVADREELVAFCERKRIEWADLAGLGTRARDGTVLAWAATNGSGDVTGIKYRDILTGRRWAEEGSRFDRPLVGGDMFASDWLIAEGETDAARLLGLREDAAVLVLPNGAGQFKREWAAMIPRGARVYLAYDADEAGDRGAAKAHRFLPDAVRLRSPAGDWCDWDGGPPEFAQILAAATGEQTTELAVVSMFEAMVEYEQEMRNPPDLNEVGVPTPFTFLEPMFPGRMYILGGYMGDGKTAASVQFLQAAADASRKVGFFSIEMSWRDLRDRAITAYGIPYEQVQRRSFQPPYDMRIKEALADLALWRVELIDEPTVTVEAIERMQATREYDLIIIDHLHRFDYGGERAKLEAIVREITNIAKRWEIPVLLLAQLRRPHSTDAHRPTMSMLRESGMIEAEASAVWFVYRKRSAEGLRTSDGEFVVAKNRFGAEALKPLHFDADNVRFTEFLIPEMREAA